MGQAITTMFPDTKRVCSFGSFDKDDPAVPKSDPIPPANTSDDTPISSPSRPVASLQPSSPAPVPNHFQRPPISSAPPHPISQVGYYGSGQPVANGVYGGVDSGVSVAPYYQGNRASFNGSGLEGVAYQAPIPAPPVHVPVMAYEDEFAEVACDRCLLTGRVPPTMIEPDICMCNKCWAEGSEDMRHVVRHRNTRHQTCPRDFPESEIKFLGTDNLDIISHWRAEWRHAHDDHSLCLPHYLFGCTQLELEQLEVVVLHNNGDHSRCPADFPPYMLKQSVPNEEDMDGTSTNGFIEAREIDDDTKLIWCAGWKHDHGDHRTCRAIYGYGCEYGKLAERMIPFNLTNKLKSRRRSASVRPRPQQSRSSSVAISQIRHAPDSNPISPGAPGAPHS